MVVFLLELRDVSKLLVKKTLPSEEPKILYCTQVTALRVRPPAQGTGNQGLYAFSQGMSHCLGLCLPMEISPKLAAR